MRVRLRMRKALLVVYFTCCLCLMVLISLQNAQERWRPPADESVSNQTLPERACHRGLVADLFPEHCPSSDRILEQLAFVPAALSDGVLVVWLPGGYSSWGVRPDTQEFRRCAVQNCRMSEKPTGAADAAAVLFRNSITHAPSQRPLGQIWIFYSLESPLNVGPLSDYGGAINWTASFRWDSDLVAPYERFTPNELIPAEQRSAPWPPKPPPTRNYAGEKTRLAVWVASHCVTTNKREDYVAELRRFVRVDTFGACGEEQCGRRDSRCTALFRQYKFYLAFENSNCRDYITEKFFVNALKNDVVPVVMGASRAEYERVAPPHSFLHVDDFGSARDLAARLTALDADDAAYNAFFAWKGTGAFIDTKFWCRLCALLNEPHAKTYADVDAWFRGPAVCR